MSYADSMFEGGAHLASSAVCCICVDLRRKPENLTIIRQFSRSLVWRRGVAEVTDGHH